MCSVKKKRSSLRSLHGILAVATKLSTDTAIAAMAQLKWNTRRRDEALAQLKWNTGLLECREERMACTVVQLGLNQ